MGDRNYPLVSILINNYNYANYLPNAIDSALSQTYPKTEVVVVDDGSTDSSREIIKSYGDCVVMILKENGGQASAFNAGFLASKGEIVCLLDSDDTFFPHKLKKVVRLFDRFPEIGWVFHPLRQINQVTGEAVDRKLRTFDGEHDMRSRMQKGRPPFPAPATSGLCFRRSLLKRILPMPEAEGVTMSDFYVKELAMGLSKGYAYNYVLGTQRIHENNIYTGRNDILDLKAIIAIQYAYWVRYNFPVLSERANRVFAIGMLYCQHLKEQEQIKLEPIIDEYWTATNTLKRLKIRVFMFYYRFRLKFNK